MTEQKFFRCKHCGNIVGMIHDSGVPVVCCGEPMELLSPNSVDAATEKHVPVVEINGDTVTVKIGSVTHPMEEAHHIEFIYLQTERGGQRKSLDVGAEPIATFKVTSDDRPVAALEYCNLHGLWKKDI